MTEKKLPPEYFGQCAEEIKGELSVLYPRLLQLRLDGLDAETGLQPTARYYRTANERAVTLYYELLGLKEGLQLVASGQDPKPLIGKLLSGINQVLGLKEEDNNLKTEIEVTLENDGRPHPTLGGGMHN